MAEDHASHLASGRDSAAAYLTVAPDHAALANSHDRHTGHRLVIIHRGGFNNQSASIRNHPFVAGTDFRDGDEAERNENPARARRASGQCRGSRLRPDP